MGSFPMHAVPARLSETPGTIRTPAPRLGQHTREILAEAGLTDQVLPLHQIAAAVAQWCGVGQAEDAEPSASVDQHASPSDRSEIAS